MPAAEPEFWQHRGLLAWLLWPVSLVFRCLSAARRIGFSVELLKRWKAPVPVIVIGNITVGGAGKTPLTLALAEMLVARGFSPGIVTRGYRGASPRWPLSVDADTSALLAGDEAVLLARRTGLPVVAAPNRVAAVRHLLQHHTCNVVLSDDGLQHYRLQRDIEIVVASAARRFGNGLLLPAGPLREPISRLRSVDLYLESGVNRHAPGYQLAHDPSLISVTDWHTRLDCSDLRQTTVHAVAGIAQPQAFFAMLSSLGLQLIEHPFPDHHLFSVEDLAFNDALPVVMTEKDAVKCTAFDLPDLWFLSVRAELDAAATTGIEQIIDRLPEPN